MSCGRLEWWSSRCPDHEKSTGEKIGLRSIHVDKGFMQTGDQARGPADSERRITHAHEEAKRQACDPEAGPNHLRAVPESCL